MHTPYADRIQAKLKEKLSPCEVQLKDESHKHAGHSGTHTEGETHFSLTITSPLFEDLNRIQRHQMVYDVLKDELAERVHALRIKALTPDESQSRR